MPTVSGDGFRGVCWLLAPPQQLWEIIERFEAFESWWGWLADFRAGGGGLVDGNVLHGTVIPPVPYRLHLTVLPQRGDRPRLVGAAVQGDLSGQAEPPLRD